MAGKKSWKKHSVSRGSVGGDKLLPLWNEANKATFVLEITFDISDHRSRRVNLYLVFGFI